MFFDQFRVNKALFEAVGAVKLILKIAANGLLYFKGSILC